MIDWEDAFNLEGLASSMREDPEAIGRRSPRTLALLQRRGLLDFEMEDDPECEFENSGEDEPLPRVDLNPE